MFKPRRGVKLTRDFQWEPPVGGLDAVSPLMGMAEDRAITLINCFPQPSGLVLREGIRTHIPTLGTPIYKLHVYAALSGEESLWATTDTGIFDVTTEASVAPTLSIGLTEGKTNSTTIATGANQYLFVVNGVDTVKRYDGTTWVGIPTLGSTPTEQYSLVTTYRQRLFFAKRRSLEIEYLPPNSISGSATNYPLGAVFRQGGYIVGLGTWTIDGGFGPEDNLVVVTSRGEVAVFAGSDPTTEATWAFKGVYFLPRPLGQDCLFKWGGDLLIITENGIYPLSKAVQSTSIDRVRQISERIKPTLSALAKRWEGQYGWQLVADPNAPYLMLNIPSRPKRQAVMNAQTGAWTFFQGIEANCFARAKNRMFFANEDGVFRLGGTSDLGKRIRGKVLSAYSPLKYRQNKKIELARPHFAANGGVLYRMGVSPNFVNPKELAEIMAFGEFDVARWGIAIFGEAVWSGIRQISDDWHTIPDEYSMWKALYLEFESKDSTVEYLGTALTYSPGNRF